MSAKLYVSSTFRDLYEHREAVRKMIRALDHIDVAMEYYVAEADRPVIRCLNDVRDCDVYIGLFAWRYGYTPEGDDLSVTEQEYQTAKKMEKPVLGFLLAPQAAWPAAFVDEGENGKKLARLRGEIESEHLCGYFEAPGELAAAVGAAVVRALDMGATPFDARREHRLMGEWRTGRGLADRERARAALRNMGSPRYVSAVRDQLLYSNDSMDVAAVADYLDELLQLSVTSRHAMPILLDLLRAEKPQTRRMCVFQIGELGLRRGGDIQSQIVRELLRLESDEDSDVRAELAHTLAKIIHRPEMRSEVRAALERLVKDPAERVRERAEESLAAM